MTNMKGSTAAEFQDTVEVSITGRALLDDPALNKGSAFPEDEYLEPD